MVTAIDEGVGEVVDALKANNLWENTLLVFSSGKILLCSQVRLYGVLFD